MKGGRGIHYEVYVRAFNSVSEYEEADIKHLVYDKVLYSEEDSVCPDCKGKGVLAVAVGDDGQSFCEECSGTGTIKD